MNKIIGTKVTDMITGVTGIVTGHVEYITGCNQALVQPQAGEDGAYRDSMWVDEQRLVQLDDSRVVLDNGPAPGFDKAPPIR